jgi:hypothetical protein
MTRIRVLPEFPLVFLFGYREQQHEFQSQLPLRVRQRFRVNRIVEVLDRSHYWLIADPESAARLNAPIG